MLSQDMSVSPMLVETQIAAARCRLKPLDTPSAGANSGCQRTALHASNMA